MSDIIEFKEKFQVDSLKLVESSHWIVSLRPAQPTIGSVVLSLKRSCESLGSINAAEGSDFPIICHQLESLLTGALGAEKFNYLALMMVDSQVHFHVIPRYSSQVDFNRKEYIDTAWPKPIDIFNLIDVDIDSLLEYLK